MNCLIELLIKLRGMVKIKHKDVLDVVPIMLCQSSSWIMSSRIYGKGRTLNLLSSPITIDPLAQDPRIGRVYTDVKIAKNTKINHIIVSFTGHYTTISLDRLPSKTKIKKE